MPAPEYDLLPCNDIKSITPGPGAHASVGGMGTQPLYPGGASSRSRSPPTVRFGSATRRDMEKVYMGKAHVPAPPHPASIRSILEPMNLSEYLSAMVELGYDQPSDLLEMGEAELQELATAVRMKPGHAARFVKRMTEPPRGAAEAQPAATASEQPLKLTVRDQHTGHQSTVLVIPSKRLVEVFEAYAASQGEAAANLQFQFDGEPLHAGSLGRLADYGLRHGDSLLAYLQPAPAGYANPRILRLARFAP